MVDLCRDSTMPEQAPIVLAAPSVPLYGEDVTDYGGKPPCVRVLVWLTKFDLLSSLLTLDRAQASLALFSLNRRLVPLRGEPCVFIGCAEKRGRDEFFI